MTALIIDNNPIESELIKQLAKQIDDLEIVCEYCNTVDAYKHLQAGPVDLLILNIEMNSSSAIELTRILKNKDTIIIFISSKKDYASEAFELDAVDYLVKPVTPLRFHQAVDKARTLFEIKGNQTNALNNEYIFIRDGAAIRRLEVNDIIYAEAMGDYVKFHTIQKTFAIHCTMKAAAERLPASNFFRTHRSFIVALNKIDIFQDGGIVIRGRFVPVADNYKKILHKRLNIL